MLDEGVIEWYKSMVHPLDWIGGFLCHAYISVAYMFIMLLVYVLVMYAWWLLLLQLHCNVEVDDVVVAM